MNFNEDELNIPNWMDKPFFENILQFNNTIKDTIQVLSFNVEPATAKGEHWASVMYRIQIIYEIQQNIHNKSIIIKIMPELDSAKKEYFGKTIIYDTEIDIYSKILPKFHEIQIKNNHKNAPVVLFGPKIIYYAKIPRYIVVLEDLKMYGNYAVLKGRMSNINESKLILKKLAKWHALSFKLNQDDNQILRNFNHSIFEFWDWYNNPTVRDCYQQFIKLLNRMQGFQTYSKRLQNYENELIEKCINSYQNTAGAANNNNSEFLVLNHGDFHLKNLMLSHENNQFKDVLFVDYQMCVFTSVAIDIQYFLYCTIDMETRQQYRSELIDFYYASFVESLQDIQYDGHHYPTIEHLNNELYKHRHLELFLLGVSVPFLYAMAFEDIELNIEEILQKENVRGIFYQNPRYIEVVRKLLPIFEEQGYF